MTVTESERGQGGIGAKVKAKIAAARERSLFFDHVMLMNEHYTKVRGNLLAGAVTYFGFLSFFPILALAFFVIGYVKQVVPESEDALRTAIGQILPGIISDKDPVPAGKISLQQIQDAKAIAGVIGLLGVLYSGLGWLSGLREAMVATFIVPKTATPNFVMGKVKDLAALALIGLVLVVSVSISGLARGFTETILDVVDLPGMLTRTLLWALAVVVGLAANALLFFTVFRLLSGTSVPAAALWRGALLSAIGFEILKVIVVNVLGSVGGSAFAPLALSITLLVWINYFSRLTVYGAAWAYTCKQDGLEVPSAVPYAVAHEPEATVRLVPPAEPSLGASLMVAARPIAVFGALLAGLWAWLRWEKARGGDS